MACPAKKILPPNTLFKILENAIDSLVKAGVENPRLNAETLICHVLKCNKANLYTNPDKHLTDEEIDSITTLVKRRALREPIQYIIGRQEFFARDFNVAKDVLIPRPETEILIEETIKTIADCGLRIISNSELQTPNSKLILDLCTGSGCIAITLAKELPDAIIYAADVSENALSIAKENAEMHGVGGRVVFLQGDLYEALLTGDRFQICPQWTAIRDCFFDLIVSNPPYIKTSDIETLEPEIKKFEPITALDGGIDGLKIIRRIVNEAHLYLKKHGWLMIEMGIGQAMNVKTLLEKSGNYNEISIIKDYSGIERVVKAQRLGARN